MDQLSSNKLLLSCEVLLPTFDVVIAGLDADLGHHGGERHGGGRGVPGLPGGISLAAPGLADVLLAGAEGRVGHPVPEVVLAGPEAANVRHLATLLATRVLQSM